MPGAGRFKQHAPFGIEIGIEHVDLHDKAVELGFRQGISTFLLQRVLGGENVERLGQVITLTGNRHMALLHRLQQGRLGARAGPVDLIGHQELGENRPLDETKGAAALSGLFQNFGAEYVGRHQIGRELDAAVIKAEHSAHGFHQLCLGKTGDANEQAVTARQHRRQCPLHHDILAVNDLADRRLDFS